MTTPIRIPALAALAAALLLTACASGGGATTTAYYDFGPLPRPEASATPATMVTPAMAATAATAAAQAAAPVPALPALIMADVSGPPALDTERMQYRLLYADARQSRPYAYNQWTSTPLQLLNQRIKARIAQGGVKVLSSTDSAASAALLRIEVDEFAQNFRSATSSSGDICLRASLFRHHRLVDQKTFQRSSPAPSADAAGGARALADATDALSADLLAWLAMLPQE